MNNIVSKKISILVFVLGFFFAPHAFAVTLTVNSNADNTTANDGLCTLREALANANSDTDTTSGDCATGSGTDTIGFSEPMVIVPTASFVISSALTIDGTLNGNGVCSTKVLGVELDGSLLADALVYSQNTSSISLRGLVLKGESSQTTLSFINTTDTTIACNIIGYETDGITDAASLHGINITGGTNVVIGGGNLGDGNVINSLGGGVLLSNDTGTIIQGNYIGLDKTGLASSGTQNVGILLADSVNILIGGDTATKRNIISGNQNGTYSTAIITQGPVDAVTIQGNYIGTDSTGNTVLANTFSGITLCGEHSCGNNIGDLPTNILIGGPNAGEGNVIGGNAGAGAIDFHDAVGVIVQGNHIGIGADGSSDIGNGYGISFGYNSDVLIGGDTAAERNVISFNTSDGVLISGDNTTNTVISGNYIGVDASGNTAAGNGSGGVHMYESQNVLIGGDTVAERNIFSGNESGIELFNSSSVVISGNYIGIGADGITDLGNQVGVIINGSDSITIGGSLELERNIISGNYFGIISDTTNDLVVKNNYMGTSVDGTEFFVLSDPGTFHNLFRTINVTSLTIGGSGDFERNIFAGQGLFSLDTVSGGSIENNYFGISSDGLSVFGIGGIVISETSDVTFGGDTIGKRNYIGTSGAQVFIGFSPIILQANTNLVVENNAFGLLPDDTSSAFSDIVVAISALYENNTLFSNNSIKNEDGGGIALFDGTVAILENSIIANESGGITGIELASQLPDDGGPDDAFIGTNANDYLDSDTTYNNGASTYSNNYINHPVLISATQNGLNVDITYMLDVPVSVNPYHIEFFSNPSGLDPSGFGQGEVYEDSDEQTISSAGPQIFTATIANATAANGITATVTDCTNIGCTTFGGTSEFSNGITGTGAGIDMATASGSQTALVDNGPYHIIKSGVYLGATIGSDTVGSVDVSDKDGVTFDAATYAPGATLTTTITASANGYMNAWIDEDANGTFETQIFSVNNAVTTGSNTLTFTAPASVGTYNVRFRYTDYAPTDLEPTGEALNGEVEDYVITVVASSTRRSSVGGPASKEYLKEHGVILATTTPVQNSQTSGTCAPNQILTQNLKAGARNGKYHAYTKAVVTEVKILQAHMNRLGFKSGAEDGILGPITDGAIKRMQIFLGTKADGYVGPLTRALINKSCGSGGLQKS